MKAIGTLVALAVALVMLLPVGAAAAVSGTFDDPIGDSVEYAADLGASTLTIGDDDTIGVNTRIVPRPPAGWGGCAYVVGTFPFETCVPSNMNVTWYFDYAPGSGDLANDGADAKVLVVPSRGQTFWESDRWDSVSGRYASGAQPLGAEDPGGVTFTLRLADLGIPKPAALRVWAVSLYKSYNGLGVLLNYSDTAGPSAVSIPAPPPSPQCLQAIGKANHLQRAIRKLRGKKGPAARKRRRKLRGKRVRATKAMPSLCQAPVSGGAAPKSAPPGCHLVTKPVLKQEGTGIYAPWVIVPEVVVEC
ncbi:MAG: hypothetical protein ACRDLL_09395 [Solirubrobacterales bacterium]